MVKIHSKSFNAGKLGTLYLKLKTGESLPFKISYRKYIQQSKFWKPERFELILMVYKWELSMELRRVV